MERKAKGSFRSDSLTNLSCELDWCYLVSFRKDDAYKYNKMDMKYRKWIVFLLQRPKRNIYIYVWIYIWNNHINHMRLTPMNAKMYTGIVVMAHPKEHSLFVKFIQPSYRLVFWALFNDRIIVYAPSTRFPHLKSILMELVYKITRYLGFEGCVILS